MNLYSCVFYDSATLFVSIVFEYGLSAVDYMNHKSANTAINEAEQQQAKKSPPTLTCGSSLARKG